MQNLHRQTLIGLFAVVAGLFLMIVAIPNWVSSPSNVRNIILSPVFWPYTLSALTIVIGLGLTVTGHFSSEDMSQEKAEVPGGYGRLAIMAVVMVIYMFGLPRLGMVWTSMLAFVATAFLVRTSHPRTAVICALCVPLILYGFFAHVASVAIPQGNFVRLP
ncbi:Tripartite tricarboxylate transporter TctB family protein [Litoreibacter ascidiaceicola]|uniref:Tripartite tricarboxylate transporter TctB family protein n=1 Tax=Litoreibacter ascidiaceicola TaxID=1486859 RepID=A0A1M4ZSN0_9RHOB|nr:tripartite tricarboxylate transporter TctB family protein [Litoreibacter ascidiaceicola]SHF21018.1 Tripartite tricarboxylate transporter TctB family protein [Litoreibacter ascidiaceicola]